jgi:hypothetical protein
VRSPSRPSWPPRCSSDSTRAARTTKSRALPSTREMVMRGSQRWMSADRPPSRRSRRDR